MEEIFKFIYDYTYNYNVFDSDTAIELFQLLLINNKINNIYRVQLSKNDCPFFSRLDCNDKKIYLNYKKMLLLYSKYINLNTDLDYKDKLILLNLMIYKVERHEIEHIIQENKMNSGNKTLENDILTLSSKYEKLYKGKDMYDYKYSYNPLERQAEINALSDVEEIVKFSNNGDLINFVNNESYITRIKGYSLYNYPFKIFFSQPIKEIFKGVDDYVNDYDYRLNLGLKLREEEYKKLVLREDEK